MKGCAKLKNNFNMNSTDEIYFWKSEWERFDPGDKLNNVSLGYLTFRFLFLSYFLGGTICSAICTEDLNLYFIFLTNWSFTLQLIYATLFFFRLAWIRIKRKDVETRLFSATTLALSDSRVKRLPWPEIIIWVFINVICVVPYVVTVGYWVFLFDPSTMASGDTCVIASDIIVHALNTPMALLDLLVMAVPIRVSHMIFPIICGLLYCLFSGIYEVSQGTYSAGREYIYHLLDWKNSPGWAAFASACAIIFVAVAHLILVWGVYRLRIVIANKYLSRDKIGRDFRNSRDSRDRIQENTNSKSDFAYDNPVVSIPLGLGLDGDESSLKPQPLPKESDHIGLDNTTPDYNTFAKE